MNEIIRINYETEEPTVSARSLYEGLEIKKRFSSWFNSNSQGFIENEDYCGAYLKYRATNAEEQKVYKIIYCL